MALVETEALVLRTYPLADADKIVIVMSLEDGLVRGVAKGAKRLKSRFGSGLEPFSVVRVSYYKKEERELVSISGIELERSYFEIASDPEFLKAFSYAADLLASFAPPHEKNERLYKMMKVCLDAAAGGCGHASVILYFEIWLLKLGGFLPSWDKCGRCGRDLAPGETTSLEADFSVSCGGCTPKGGVKTIKPEQRKAFLFAQTTSPQKFDGFAKEAREDIASVSAILRKMIERILNREIGGAAAKG